MKKLTQLLTVLCAILIMAACNAPKMDDHAAKADQMKARFVTLNECFNTGNTAAIDTLLDANAKDHSEDPSMDLPDGPEGLKQIIGMYRAGTPDMKSDIKYMAVDGDILMAYGTVSGNNSGMMMGMPATNKSWSADFCDVLKFNDKMQITDHWGVFDGMKMMKDIGMMPPPPMPEDTTKRM